MSRERLRSSAPERLASKFLGVMLGTFAGDALGMPVENWPPERIARAFGTLDTFYSAKLWLRSYAALFGAMHQPTQALGGVPLGRGTYTDDTQMMIGVAESLIACGGFDGADMARRFVENYDARRGYGRGAMQAIRALRNGVPWEAVGAQLFGGKGSFGNGAAMRVAPVGCFYHDDPAELRRVADLSASITHAHPLGRQGAVLLASAVALAIRLEPDAAFESRAFLDKLVTSLPADGDEARRSGADEFRSRLARIEDLLARSPTVREVVEALGNDVTAPGSVPAALYAFLAHPHSFREAVVYAVNLGGDTDTIGAMTGAVAGALHGVESIPGEWLAALENGEKGRDYGRHLAETLWETWRQGVDSHG